MECKKCKSYKPIKNGYGKCTSDKFVYTGNQDYMFEMEDDDEFNNPKDIVIPCDGLGYSDMECYRAIVEVGEKFGCIHFKEV